MLFNKIILNARWRDLLGLRGLRKRLLEGAVLLLLLIILDLGAKNSEPEFEQYQQGVMEEQYRYYRNNYYESGWDEINAYLDEIMETERNAWEWNRFRTLVEWYRINEIENTFTYEGMTNDVDYRNQLENWEADANREIEYLRARYSVEEAELGMEVWTNSDKWIEEILSDTETPNLVDSKMLLNLDESRQELQRAMAAWKRAGGVEGKVKEYMFRVTNSISSNKSVYEGILEEEWTKELDEKSTARIKELLESRYKMIALEHAQIGLWHFTKVYKEAIEKDNILSLFEGSSYQMPEGERILSNAYQKSEDLKALMANRLGGISEEGNEAWLFNQKTEELKNVLNDGHRIWESKYQELMNQMGAWSMKTRSNYLGGLEEWDKVYTNLLGMKNNWYADMEKMISDEMGVYDQEITVLIEEKEKALTEYEETIAHNIQRYQNYMENLKQAVTETADKIDMAKANINWINDQMEIKNIKITNLEAQTNDLANQPFVYTGFFFGLNAYYSNALENYKSNQQKAIDVISSDIEFYKSQYDSYNVVKTNWEYQLDELEKQLELTLEKVGKAEESVGGLFGGDMETSLLSEKGRELRWAMEEEALAKQAMEKSKAILEYATDTNQKSLDQITDDLMTISAQLTNAQKAYDEKMENLEKNSPELLTHQSNIQARLKELKSNQLIYQEAEDAYNQAITDWETATTKKESIYQTYRVAYRKTIKDYLSNVDGHQTSLSNYYTETGEIFSEEKMQSDMDYWITTIEEYARRVSNRNKMEAWQGDYEGIGLTDLENHLFGEGGSSTDIDSDNKVLRIKTILNEMGRLEAEEAAISNLIGLTQDDEIRKTMAEKITRARAGVGKESSDYGWEPYHLYLGLSNLITDETVDWNNIIATLSQKINDFGMSNDLFVLGENGGRYYRLNEAYRTDYAYLLMAEKISHQLYQTNSQGEEYDLGSKTGYNNYLTYLETNQGEELGRIGGEMYDLHYRKYLSNHTEALYRLEYFGGYSYSATNEITVEQDFRSMSEYISYFSGDARSIYSNMVAGINSLREYIDEVRQGFTLNGEGGYGMGEMEKWVSTLEELRSQWRQQDGQAWVISNHNYNMEKNTSGQEYDTTWIDSLQSNMSVYSNLSQSASQYLIALDHIMLTNDISARKDIYNQLKHDISLLEKEEEEEEEEETIWKGNFVKERRAVLSAFSNMDYRVTGDNEIEKFSQDFKQVVLELHKKLLELKDGIWEEEAYYQALLDYAINLNLDQKVLRLGEYIDHRYRSIRGSRILGEDPYEAYYEWETENLGKLTAEAWKEAIRTIDELTNAGTAPIKGQDQQEFDTYQQQVADWMATINQNKDEGLEGMYRLKESMSDYGYRSNRVNYNQWLWSIYNSLSSMAKNNQKIKNTVNDRDFSVWSNVIDKIITTVSKNVNVKNFKIDRDYHFFNSYYYPKFSFQYTDKDNKVSDVIVWSSPCMSETSVYYCLYYRNYYHKNTFTSLLTNSGYSKSSAETQIEEWLSEYGEAKLSDHAEKKLKILETAQTQVKNAQDAYWQAEDAYVSNYQNNFVLKRKEVQAAAEVVGTVRSEYETLRAIYDFAYLLKMARDQESDSKNLEEGRTKPGIVEQLNRLEAVVPGVTDVLGFDITGNPNEPGFEEGKDEISNRSLGMHDTILNMILDTAKIDHQNSLDRYEDAQTMTYYLSNIYRIERKEQENTLSSITDGISDGKNSNYEGMKKLGLIDGKMEIAKKKLDQEIKIYKQEYLEAKEKYRQNLAELIADNVKIEENNDPEVMYEMVVIWMEEIDNISLYESLPESFKESTDTVHQYAITYYGNSTISSIVRNLRYHQRRYENDNRSEKKYHRKFRRCLKLCPNYKYARNKHRKNKKTFRGNFNFYLTKLKQIFENAREAREIYFEKKTIYEKYFEKIGVVYEGDQSDLNHQKETNYQKLYSIITNRLLNNDELYLVNSDLDYLSLNNDKNNGDGKYVMLISNQVLNGKVESSITIEQSLIGYQDYLRDRFFIYQSNFGQELHRFPAQKYVFTSDELKEMDLYEYLTYHISLSYPEYKYQTNINNHVSFFLPAVDRLEQEETVYRNLITQLIPQVGGASISDYFLKEYSRVMTNSYQMKQLQNIEFQNHRWNEKIFTLIDQQSTMKNKLIMLLNHGLTEWEWDLEDYYAQWEVWDKNRLDQIGEVLDSYRTQLQELRDEQIAWEDRYKNRWMQSLYDDVINYRNEQALIKEATQKKIREQNEKLAQEQQQRLEELERARVKSNENWEAEQIRIEEELAIAKDAEEKLKIEQERSNTHYQREAQEQAYREEQNRIRQHYAEVQQTKQAEEQLQAQSLIDEYFKNSVLAGEKRQWVKNDANDLENSIDNLVNDLNNKYRKALSIGEDIDFYKDLEILQKNLEKRLTKVGNKYATKLPRIKDEFTVTVLDTTPMNMVEVRKLMALGQDMEEEYLELQKLRLYEMMMEYHQGQEEFIRERQEDINLQRSLVLAEEYMFKNIKEQMKIFGIHNNSPYHRSLDRASDELGRHGINGYYSMKYDNDQELAFQRSYIQDVSLFTEAISWQSLILIKYADVNINLISPDDDWEKIVGMSYFELRHWQEIYTSQLQKDMISTMDDIEEYLQNDMGRFIESYQDLFEDYMDGVTDAGKAWWQKKLALGKGLEWLTLGNVFSFILDVAIAVSSFLTAGATSGLAIVKNMASMTANAIYYGPDYDGTAAAIGLLSSGITLGLSSALPGSSTLVEATASSATKLGVDLGMGALKQTISFGTTYTITGAITGDWKFDAGEYLTSLGTTMASTAVFSSIDTHMANTGNNWALDKQLAKTMVSGTFNTMGNGIYAGITGKKMSFSELTGWDGTTVGELVGAGILDNQTRTKMKKYTEKNYSEKDAETMVNLDEVAEHLKSQLEKGELSEALREEYEKELRVIEEERVALAEKYPEEEGQSVPAFPPVFPATIVRNPFEKIRRKEGEDEGEGGEPSGDGSGQTGSGQTKGEGEFGLTEGAREEKISEIMKANPEMTTEEAMKMLDEGEDYEISSEDTKRGEEEGKLYTKKKGDKVYGRVFVRNSSNLDNSEDKKKLIDDALSVSNSINGNEVQIISVQRNKDPKSEHYLGKAMDLFAPSMKSDDNTEFAKIVYKTDLFRRVGYYERKNTVHVDYSLKKLQKTQARKNLNKGVFRAPWDQKLNDGDGAHDDWYFQKHQTEKWD